jgi:hypothetical protein
MCALFVKNCCAMNAVPFVSKAAGADYVGWDVMAAFLLTKATHASLAADCVAMNATSTCVKGAAVCFVMTAMKQIHGWTLDLVGDFARIAS